MLQNSGASYIWSTGETTAMITPPLTGSGTAIQVTVDIFGCMTSDEIMIMTRETPQFSIRDDETICENETVTVAVDLSLIHI